VNPVLKQSWFICNHCQPFMLLFPKNKGAQNYTFTKSYNNIQPENVRHTRSQGLTLVSEVDKKYSMLEWQMWLTNDKG
jgi:hypothetical protein